MKNQAVALLTILSISLQSFAMDRKEIAQAIEQTSPEVEAKVNLAIERNQTLIKEIESVEAQIKELNADVKKNSKDVKRSLWMSAGIVAFVISTAMLLDKYPNQLGGDRPGAAMLQGYIFMLGVFAEAGVLGNAGLNKVLVMIDNNKIEGLQESLMLLKGQLKAEIQKMQE